MLMPLVLAVVAGMIGLLYWSVQKQDTRMGRTPAHRMKNATTAQDFIMIEGITENMIELSGDEYRIIVEVTPTNFFLLNQDEQNAIQDGWRQLCDSLQEPFQIYVPSLRVNPRHNLMALQERQGQLPPALQTYSQDLVESVASWVRSGSLLKKGYYIVLQASPEPGETSSVDTIKSRMETSLTRVISQMERIGLSARPLPGAEAAQVLFSAYNRERGRVYQLEDLAEAGVWSLFSTSSVPSPLRNV